ncbi:MAG: S-layer homology domain-containing protein [Prevotella sp.]|jgi:hypothetical protein|nr:S-layer homology domain-containing protein [Prevotella sp.]
MLVTVLYRHAGMPEVAATECIFEDVKQGDWFYDAVMWAYDSGITMGMGKTLFGSELPVTREQAAVFIHRYVKTQAIDWIEQGLAEDAFRDASGVSDWAKEAVLWCQANGIIQGTPNHYFN